MTYDNIKKDVLSLGFTDDLEDEGYFLLALNRAMRFLASEFPKKKTLCLARIYEAPKKTFDTSYNVTISLQKGECATFLYHRFDGAILFAQRELPLVEGSGTYTYQAKEDGEFHLTGDARMYAISIYKPDTAPSLCEANLPFVEYDISKYDTQASVICAVPKTAYGETILGASVDGLRVRLPRQFHGIFLVEYETSPKEIRQGDVEIEIEERLFPLFSLLVCGYLWLEDEPERAQYYMALYREGRERMRTSGSTYSEKYTADALGWT